MKKLLSTLLLITSTVFYSQTAITDRNFKGAIKDCLSTNPIDGLCHNSDYGSMPDWDVSRVTDMSHAFNGKIDFNGDISKWDTRSVINMRFMFDDAKAFNQNINTKEVTTVNGVTYTAWDISNVKDMYGIFFQAEKFNQPLHNWDVSNLKDTGMAAMFYGAISFNQNINKTKVKVNGRSYTAWDVSNVTDMHYMFFKAEKFNQPLHKWDVRNVEDMDQMFRFAKSFDQPLNEWNVTKVINMNSLFDHSGLSVYNYDDILIGWSGKKVQSNVELGAYGINYCKASVERQSLIDKKGWKITDRQKCPSKTKITDTNFKEAIEDCLKKEKESNGNCTGSEYGPMPAWDVSQVTDMSEAFKDKKNFNGDISNWNVRKVTNMKSMFAMASSFNQPLNNWDVSNVKDMENMFYEAEKFNQRLDNWNVSNVIDMSSMFSGATAFNHYLVSYDGWDVSKVTNMAKMFYFATSFNEPLNNWNVSNVTNMNYMFYAAKSFDQPLDNWNVSKVTKMNFMFDYSDLSLENYDSTLIGWSGQKVQSNVELRAYGINYCNSSAARQSLIDDKQWKITDDGYKCPISITNANFRKAIKDCLKEDSNGNCKDSEYGPMPYWDVSQVTDMSRAFKEGTNFNGDISKWDVSNVTNMESMFFHASSFNGDINTKEVTVNRKTYTAWDVSNVTNMTSMFAEAENFNRDISDWDTSNLTNMTSMFAMAENFNRDISDWDTSKVTIMRSMFAMTDTFNQPLNNWDVSNVKDMQNMFYHAKKFNQPLHNWNVRKVENMNNLFNNSDLSTDNYDSTLIGWSKQNVQRNVKLGASGINYCKSWFARFKLWFYFNWSFSDAGLSNYGCYFSNIFTASKHDQNKTLSIDNPKNQLDISIYPNPTSGMVHIEGNFTQLKVVVYDLLGKQLINKFIKNHVIDLSHLENGVYILQLFDGVKLSTKKIIKN